MSGGLYRRFLKDSAKTLGPLNSLIKGSDKAKNRKIIWLDEHEQAFTKKEALKSGENLNDEDKSPPLIVSTDASAIHARTVLE